MAGGCDKRFKQPYMMKNWRHRAKGKPPVLRLHTEVS
jgi:hypothetical protein